MRPIEPYKCKVVEPIKFLTREDRAAIIREAGYNLFKVRAEDVTIDLLTDSGTSAMSAAQWGAMMIGDEAYAGSPSFFRFEKVIRELTGYRHVIPTHQGRAAERILFSILGRAGRTIPNNTHFDTTRANVEYSGAVAADLPTPGATDTTSEAPFKGDIDLRALSQLIERDGAAYIPLAMITVTNNSAGGQPVSMANIREMSRICRQAKIPFFLDACRFAENCYFIQQREEGYAGRDIRDIARELFSYADGCTMSAKKDALVNIGGFLAMNSDDLAEQCRNLLILTEGFPTYGGLAGRDLEAIAQGLLEVLEQEYLENRIQTVAYLGDRLHQSGVPVIRPSGGHAVYIDAKRFLSHIPPAQFPAQVLACELYLEGGIRGVEVGSLMFARKNPADGKDLPAPHEFVRLAIPRRVYSRNQLDYVAEAVIEVHHRREKLRGLRLVKQAPYLRHFTAVLEPL